MWSDLRSENTTKFPMDHRIFTTLLLGIGEPHHFVILSHTVWARSAGRAASSFL